MEKSLLLIDDDVNIRRAVTLLLKPHGYLVTEAANGAEALEILKNFNFSLIVLDQNMPVMDGLAFLHELRATIKSPAPVLMMSGETAVEIRQKAFALGVYDYISKPEDPDVLLARVANGMQIAELIEFRKETRRDLSMSAKILNRMAPPDTIEAPRFTLRTWRDSLLEIGGDISLAFATDTDFPFFVIGDITGHGISAALFAIFIDVAVRRAYRESMLPHKILTRLNRELCESLPANFFVTMFCCAFDARRGILHYANAGHPSPYLRAGGKNHLLDAVRQPLLGVSPYQVYEGASTPLNAGDWLLAYTDGVLDIYEAEKYNSDPIVEKLVSSGYSGTETFNNLINYLRTQQGVMDDRTIMIFESH